MHFEGAPINAAIRGGQYTHNSLAKTANPKFYLFIHRIANFPQLIAR